MDDLAGEFDYLHVFVTTQAELNRDFPSLRDHLKPSGMLWVSWPKGRRDGTDLTLPIVIKIGYGHGLVESTCLRVNDTWSGLKFTHPKPGKTYRNSDGCAPWAELMPTNSSPRLGIYGPRQPRRPGGSGLRRGDYLDRNLRLHRFGAVSP